MRPAVSRSPRALLVVRAAWAIAMVAVLAWWLSGGVGSSDSTRSLGGERHLLAMLALIALTFPLGLAWAVLLNLAGYLWVLTATDLAVPDALLTCMVWLGFFGLGYLQWFKLVPALVRRWRR
jgi:hypothetical protein